MPDTVNAPARPDIRGKGMSFYTESASATEAWLAAARFLLDNDEAVGLHVNIACPTDADHTVVDALDQKLLEADAIACKHVATTIFPEGLWTGVAGRDPEQLFHHYNREGGFYERLRNRRRRSGHNDWGTYFRRFSLPEFGRNGRCQLAHALEALHRAKKPKGAIHLHASLPSDGFRAQGGPCLQLITLHVATADDNHALSACAIYRNHDFFQKALGNYIGLGNLLAFLAEASDLKVGNLHVISGHAFLAPKGPVIEVVDAIGA